jgi:hypothetical protein
MSNYSDIKFAGTSAQEPPFRNIIINGDMSIAQRGTSFTCSNATGSKYTLDRFQYIDVDTPDSVYTITQDTDVPSGQGFAKSLKVDVATADATLDAGDGTQIEHRVEAQNLQYLKFGTSNAESLTLSFWVKSNKTGTYVVRLLQPDASSRMVTYAYTISSASTWEKKTISIPGDTSGTINNDNGNGLNITWWLSAGTDYQSGSLASTWQSYSNGDSAVGQVNLADNTANEWYITGVQLEAGTTASDFEFLPYDVNLQRCQRYYYLHVSGSQDVGVGGYYSSSHIFFNITFPNTMRAVPTVVYVSGTDYYKISRNGATDNFNDIAGGGVASLNEVSLYNNTQVSGTAGDAGYVRSNNASASIALNSEL